MTTSAPPLMLSAPAHSITWNGPDSDVDHMPLDILDAKLLLIPENRENRGGSPFMVILDEYGYYMNPPPPKDSAFIHSFAMTLACVQHRQELLAGVAALPVVSCCQDHNREPPCHQLSTRTWHAKHFFPSLDLA